MALLCCIPDLPRLLRAKDETEIECRRMKDKQKSTDEGRKAKIKDENRRTKIALLGHRSACVKTLRSRTPQGRGRGVGRPPRPPLDMGLDHPPSNVVGRALDAAVGALIFLSSIFSVLSVPAVAPLFLR